MFESDYDAEERQMQERLDEDLAVEAEQQRRRAEDDERRHEAGRARDDDLDTPYRLDY